MVRSLLEMLRMIQPPNDSTPWEVCVVVLTVLLFTVHARADGPPVSDALPGKTPHERTASNSVYAEIGGPALLYSVNYDRMFGEHFSLRAGAAYWKFYDFGDDPNARALFPVIANGLVGPADHKLEIGAGGVLGYVFPSSGYNAIHGGAQFYGAATIGYRYAPREGGFNFRAAITPLFGGPLGPVLPWAGISVGYGL